MAQERPELVEIRDIDPNVKQRQASNPASSVWVGASAGTGKTKVLTDRVLRLLLPQAENLVGTPPHKILCLTYTKAGASEMALRISKTLSRWAVLPEGHEDEDKTLRKELKSLLGRPAQAYEITAARRLFAGVVDHPGGLPIMTIHAFCQSLLGRFPLEAGLSPNIKVLEDAPAAALLEKARVAVLLKAAKSPGTPLADALNHLATTVNEDQFFKLLAALQSERRQFRELLKNFGVEGFYTKLCAFLGVVPGLDVLREACADGAFDAPALAEAARVLGQGTGLTDGPRANCLRAWLDAPLDIRLGNFEDYKDLFFTKGDVPTLRAKLMPVGLAGKYPESDVALWTEAYRIEAVLDRANRAKSALLTRDLFMLAEAIAGGYEALKTAEGALDFDDLILKTLTLLRGMPGWVQYKLDQGLDHLLVDEAQDTNPEQWDILEALTHEFFAGEGARGVMGRSVFVVGDSKQSIYSFQRASPKEFERMKTFFADKLQAVGRVLEPVDLKASFRSAPAVLALVDAVFEGGVLGPELVQHDSRRKAQAGLVELWPLYETPKREKPDFWTGPISVDETKSGPVLLAARIAETVSGWITRSEILQSRGRPIRPGDIMILLKNRSRAGLIMRALRQKGIPVGGADRMVLNDQLPVEDLMAAAGFALLPSDDLTLACLLKSPLIGMNEEDLFALAAYRQGDLWGAIQPLPLRGYLDGLIHLGRSARPYEFFSHILNMPCPQARSGLAAMQARLGEDAADPLGELLESALVFEGSNPPSLQLFTDWQSRQKSEIKREMDTADDEGDQGFVRIMTVHGSKGLQAPIVILPDTIRISKSSPNQNQRRLLWPHQTDLDVPLWSPATDMDFTIYKDAIARLEAREDAEYRRLLYVALTRAEDRLYIGGAVGRRKAIPESWYNTVAKGFERMDHVEVLEDGTQRFTNSQNGEADKRAKVKEAAAEIKTLPDWAFTPPESEPTPTRPLTPSRPSLPDQPARSPLDGSDEGVFLRGTLTHKLLQFLPDLAPDKRAASGRIYLERYGAMFEKSVRDEILTETLSVLNHPDFAPLFGPGSLAEVPISGMVNPGQLISGQIDRLLITPDKILIVDYKTNRKPPLSPKDIPPGYIVQMQSYASLLREIYPGREIATALIWTDGPVLMPL